jgi:hypothetical protein
MDSSKVFKQSIPTIGLSLEMGTDAVPDDDRYHVLLNGEIVLSTGSKARALKAYKELRQELAPDNSGASRPDPDELLKRLKAEVEINAVMGASSAAKRAHATYKRGTAARWKSS